MKVCFSTIIWIALSLTPLRAEFSVCQQESEDSSTASQSTCGVEAQSPLNEDLILSLQEIDHSLSGRAWSDRAYESFHESLIKRLKELLLVQEYELKCFEDSEEEGFYIPTSVAQRRVIDCDELRTRNYDLLSTITTEKRLNLALRSTTTFSQLNTNTFNLGYDEENHYRGNPRRKWIKENYPDLSEEDQRKYFEFSKHVDFELNHNDKANRGEPTPILTPMEFELIEKTRKDEFDQATQEVLTQFKEDKYFEDCIGEDEDGTLFFKSNVEEGSRFDSCGFDKDKTLHSSYDNPFEMFEKRRNEQLSGNSRRTYGAKYDRITEIINQNPFASYTNLRMDDFPLETDSEEVVGQKIEGIREQVRKGKSEVLEALKNEISDLENLSDISDKRSDILTYYPELFDHYLSLQNPNEASCSVLNRDQRRFNRRKTAKTIVRHGGAIIGGIACPFTMGIGCAVALGLELGLGVLPGMEKGQRTFNQYLSGIGDAEEYEQAKSDLFMDVAFLPLGVVGFPVGKALQASAHLSRAVGPQTLALRSVVRHNAGLSDAARIDKARDVLQVSDITAQSTKGRALIKAHQVGSQRAGSGVFNYSPAELRQKVHILREAGYTPSQIRTLLNSGLAGEAGEGLFSRLLRPFRRRRVSSEAFQAFKTQHLDSMEAAHAANPKPVKKLSAATLESDLPKKALTRIRKLKKLAAETKFPSAEFIKNNYTDSRRYIGKILAESGEMGPALIKAQLKLNNAAAWTEYMEKLSVDVFKAMKESGDPKLLEKLKEGVLDEATFEKVLIDRAKARGLKPYTIKPGTGLLSFRQFRRVLKKGPIIDRAFDPGSALKQGHGPYPHLLQLDFVADDVVKSLSEQRGAPARAQEMFNFFSTKDGLTVWNDMFDQYGISTTTLGDTTVITKKFVREGLGIEPRHVIPD